MKTKHIHDFGSMKVVKVVADNMSFDRNKNGDFAFIVRYCPCGEESPIEYGNRKKMYEHIELLTERG